MRRSWIIECECGTAVRGDSEDALLAAAEAHIAQAHAVAAGATTRHDLLAMARREEEDRG